MDHRLLRLRFRDIEALVAIARLGSLRGAAKAVGVSQPALGATLTEIEHALGGALYVRTRGGLAPTAFGRSIVSASQVLLKEFDNFKSAARGEKSPPLKLGCTPFLAHIILPRWVKSMSEESIEVSEGAVPELLDKLATGKLDAVLGLYPGADSSFRGFRHYLMRLEPLRIVCSSKLVVASSWKRLVTAPWILPPKPSVMRHAIEARFMAEGLVPPTPRIGSANMATNLRLAKIGVGVAAIAESYLREGDNSEGLQSLRLRQPPEVPISLVIREGSDVQPRIQAAIQALKVSGT